MNLRGYDPEGQVTGGQALAALLRALGVRDKDLPSTTDEQAAVYRSELAHMADQGRRVLLVADNASTAAQVSPLIPARREHRLVVTSRDILAALPARQLGLHELAPGPARELISESLTLRFVKSPRCEGRNPRTKQLMGTVRPNRARVSTVMPPVVARPGAGSG